METKNKFYALFLRSSPHGESGESINTIYDMANSCKRCGTGAIVIPPLVVKTSYKKELTLTLNDDFLLSENVYNHLKLANVKGVENLYKVLNKRTNTVVYYHLTSPYIFPKMLPTSEGIQTEDQCTECHRDGYYDKIIMKPFMPSIPIPAVYKYKIEDVSFLNQSDIYTTWECFCVSNLIASEKYVVGYARPVIIIRENVKLILESLKIKKLEFEPIIINE